MCDMPRGISHAVVGALAFSIMWCGCNHTREANHRDTRSALMCVLLASREWPALRSASDPIPEVRSLVRSGVGMNGEHRCTAEARRLAAAERDAWGTPIVYELVDSSPGLVIVEVRSWGADGKRSPDDLTERLLLSIE